MRTERKGKKANGRLEFYYITHVDNLPSIFAKGLLSNKRVNETGLSYKKIANTEILKKRKEKGLEDYVNLYINPRNAMMYQISRLGWNLAILAIKGEVLKHYPDIKISIGNAASDYSILIDRSGISNIHLTKLLSEVRKIKDWTSETQIDISRFFKDNRPYRFLSLKVFLQSEVLIRGMVDRKFFSCIYVPKDELKSHLKELVNSYNIPVINAPELFFKPIRREKVLENIWIVQGDMFNSEYELLTISVNTVGVMGKGLASRFKYLYPEIYVVYENLCKQGILKLGKPFIYDAPELGRKFLLFPTKGHWREKSRLDKIEEGLKWFLDNYSKYEIKSAAFPALGCGLGGLNWVEVGPIMVKYLSMAKIPIEIYLPEEREPLESYFKKISI